MGAEYFVEYVRTQLLTTYSQDQVLRQGLRVQTSLNPLVQRQAYDAVYGLLDRAADPGRRPGGSGSRRSGGGHGRGQELGEVEGQPRRRRGGRRQRSPGRVHVQAVRAGRHRARGYTLESSFPGPAKLILPKADEGKDWEVSNYEDESFGSINLIDATVTR